MIVPRLAGYTVGVTAARRREEFGTALERRGARVIYGPAIRLVPLADDTLLLDATRRCLATPLDHVIVTTGIGYRGWLDTVETWGLAEPLTAALGDATILTRGPKARGAVRASGLREAWSPDSESTAEALDHLLATYPVAGRRIAVQLHGEPLTDLVAALREAGAEVVEVPVYRWVPPTDDAPLRRIVQATAAAALDCVTFTSAPAAANFLHTADALDCRDHLVAALKGPVLCAAVGPATAAPLLAADIPVTQPDRYRLGALARVVVEQLPARATHFSAAGHHLELRGHAVLLDGTYLELSTSALTLLRELAGRPGHIFTRHTLAVLLPGDTRDGHAVEVAISRLRAALGDPAIIQTHIKRGYRLAVEIEPQPR